MKQTKQSNELSGVGKEKKSGLFRVLLVLIPLLFVTAVILIIATFADVNVFDKAKVWSQKLPFIGESEKKEEEAADVVFEERVVTLQAEIQEKEAQLFTLQQELDKSVSENKELLSEQAKLLDEIAALVDGKDNSKRKFQEIVTTFEQMPAKSSAPVITKMSDAEALRILTSLKPNTLAAILEKMSPEEAAKYTTMMTNED